MVVVVVVVVVMVEVLVVILFCHLWTVDYSAQNMISISHTSLLLSWPLQSLAPIYEKLAKVFEGDKSVLIAKVDATAEEDLGKR